MFIYGAISEAILSPTGIGVVNVEEFVVIVVGVAAAIPDVFELVWLFTLK